MGEGFCIVLLDGEILCREVFWLRTGLLHGDDMPSTKPAFLAQRDDKEMQTWRQDFDWILQ